MANVNQARERAAPGGHAVVYLRAEAELKSRKDLVEATRLMAAVELGASTDRRWSAEQKAQELAEKINAIEGHPETHPAELEEYIRVRDALGAQVAVLNEMRRSFSQLLERTDAG